MKFYNSVGPNPRMVKMFMAEKGIDLPRAEVNLMGGENRQAPYTDKNPSGQTPALELDNGDILAEITAICEYLDEKHPNPPLMGVTPEERAETRMWTRRIDLNIVEPMANGFRYSQGLQLFQSRMRCMPQAADDLKALAQEKLTWLDGLIAGKTWICGDRFTMADVLLFAFLEFGASVGQPLNPDNKNIAAWRDRVAARPSAAASA
jgi:glutathione S-transferase